jgi:hypothetical protein
VKGEARGAWSVCAFVDAVDKRPTPIPYRVTSLIRNREHAYRGTSLMRNSAPLGPYSRNMSVALWRPQKGGLFLLSEVPLYLCFHPKVDGCEPHSRGVNLRIQGYLAHKKMPPSLGPPYGPRHSPTAWSYGKAVSYGRGTPAVVYAEMVRKSRADGAGSGSEEGSYLRLIDICVTQLLARE